MMMNRFLITFLLVFAATLATVRSSECAANAIKPELREIRSLLYHHQALLRNAARRYSALVHQLTDNITAGDNDRITDRVLVVRYGLNRFVATVVEASRLFLSRCDRALRRASKRATRNCPNVNGVDQLLDSIRNGLRYELKRRILEKSDDELYRIVGTATQNAVRLVQQSVDDADVDETNDTTLVLRDLFAHLIQSFEFEIRDRQRRYALFVERKLLAGVVSAKRIE